MMLLGPTRDAAVGAPIPPRLSRLTKYALPFLPTANTRLEGVAPGTSEDALGAVLQRSYAGAAFVRLAGSSLPEIKHVAHTNFCDIGWRVDPSGRAILVSAIDNLLKGASGQAVQNMNVMLGLDETTGLL